MSEFLSQSQRKLVLMGISATAAAVISYWIYSRFIKKRSNSSGGSSEELSEGSEYEKAKKRQTSDKISGSGSLN